MRKERKWMNEKITEKGMRKEERKWIRKERKLIRKEKKGMNEERRRKQLRLTAPASQKYRAPNENRIR